MKVAIIGGGIAGMACAWQLARVAHVEVLLLESEAEPFVHASGRNAAIFRPLEDSPALIELALRSYDLLAELGDRATLLNEVGLQLTARDSVTLEPLLRAAKSAGLHCELQDEAGLARKNPWLSGGSAQSGVFLPQGGVLDLKQIAAQLRRQITALGATFIYHAQVDRIETSGERVCGVRTRDGVRIACDHVVLAAGAWSQALAAEIGLDFPLLPHRRHLVQLVAASNFTGSVPVAWDLDLGSYFRVDQSGILACPGDHTPHPPGVPDVAPEIVAGLANKLADMAPQLPPLRIARSWACIRTLTHDNHMVLGPDPRLHGFSWLAGLGGHGMSVGLAAAELVAAALTEHLDVPSAFSPARVMLRP